MRSRFAASAPPVLHVRCGPRGARPTGGAASSVFASVVIWASGTPSLALLGEDRADGRLPLVGDVRLDAVAELEDLLLAVAHLLEALARELLALGHELPHV